MDPNAVPGPGDPKPPEPNRAALDEVTSFLTAALATTSPCWRLFCVCHSVCPFTCCTLSPHSYQHLLLFAVAIAARARRLNLVLLPALSQARMEVQAERIAEAKRRARDVSRHNLLAAANADALDELERDPGGPGRAPPPGVVPARACRGAGRLEGRAGPCRLIPGRLPAGLGSTVPRPSPRASQGDTVAPPGSLGLLHAPLPRRGGHDPPAFVVFVAI